MWIGTTMTTFSKVLQPSLTAFDHRLVLYFHIRHVPVEYYLFTFSICFMKRVYCISFLRHLILNCYEFETETDNVAEWKYSHVIVKWIFKSAILVLHPCFLYRSRYSHVKICHGFCVQSSKITVFLRLLSTLLFCIDLCVWLICLYRQLMIVAIILSKQNKYNKVVNTIRINANVKWDIIYDILEWPHTISLRRYFSVRGRFSNVLCLV